MEVLFPLVSYPEEKIHDAAFKPTTGLSSINLTTPCELGFPASSHFLI